MRPVLPTGAYLSPATGPPAVAMLDEQVGGANLPLEGAWGGGVLGTGAVMGGHVVFQFVRVGALRGLPAGDFFDRVEVVGEVLGV